MPGLTAGGIFSSQGGSERSHGLEKTMKLLETKDVRCDSPGLRYGTMIDDSYSSSLDIFALSAP